MLPEVFKAFDFKNKDSQTFSIQMMLFHYMLSQYSVSFNSYMYYCILSQSSCAAQSWFLLI